MPEVLTQTAPERVESSGRAMITSAQISRRVHAMGREISKVYADIDTPLVLVVGWTPGKNVGVVCYEVKNDGTRLEGVWTGLGASKLGAETLDRR